MLLSLLAFNSQFRGALPAAVHLLLGVGLGVAVWFGAVLLLDRELLREARSLLKK